MLYYIIKYYIILILYYILLYSLYLIVLDVDNKLWRNWMNVHMNICCVWYIWFMHKHTHAYAYIYMIYIYICTDTYRNEFHICSLSRGPIASPKPWARMRPGQKARQPGPTSHADMVEQIPERIQWKPKKQHPQNWWNPTKSQYLFKMWPVKIIQNAWHAKTDVFQLKHVFGLLKSG